MDNQPWLDSVRERLDREALPPSYVQRLIKELGDHLDDLSEEAVDADPVSRLGEPNQVASAAVVAYRKRRLVGRHPVAAFMVFAISPIVPQYILFIVGASAIMMLRTDRTLDWSENHWILSPLIVACSILASVFYGELVMRLGIGMKWMFASCGLLAAFATLMEFGLGVSMMVPVQFAVPFVAGWWFATQKHSQSYPATSFLIFTISPLLSYWLLWLVIGLTFATVFSFFTAILGTDAGWVLSILLAYVVPAVVLIALCWKHAKAYVPRRKWLVASCAVLATLVATPLLLLLPLLFLLMPTVLTSLLYCHLAKGYDFGKTWLVVSCAVLAVYGAMCGPLSVVNLGRHEGLQLALMACICLAQFLIPLAIGWWFMRREPHQDQMQLAS